MEEKIELWICLIIKCKEDKLKILDGKYISSVIRSEIKTEALVKIPSIYIAFKRPKVILPITKIIPKILSFILY